MSVKTNGKKVALWIITSIVAACALVVLLMVIFFKTYDPDKYDRQTELNSDQQILNEQQILTEV